MLRALAAEARARASEIIVETQHQRSMVRERATERPRGSVSRVAPRLNRRTDS
jgi:hypothetical protein